jgi:beta-mannosidase
MLDTLSLDGTWDLRWNDAQRGPKITNIDPAYAMTATVPGEVHLDLERHGILPDRHVGLGHLAGRWVEQCRWRYDRTFTAPASAVGAKAWLVFEGLDHHAVIRLNGQEVGRHANSFRPCRIEIGAKLKAGANLLQVEIESGLNGTADLPSHGYVGADHRDSKRHWLRKPQSEAGWDWAPRLLNVGLQGGVRLEWTTAAVRLDQVMPLATVEADLQTGRLRLRAAVEGLRDTAVPVRLRVRCAGVEAVVDAEAKPGLQVIEASLTVAQPKLWWPVGHGAQDRYEVEVELLAGDVVVASNRQRVGFRRIEIDQSPCPAGGRWFYLLINNRRIFCKGGNYVPADTVVAAITPGKTRRLVELAVEQHFNLLRVWGGGRYEDEAFYDACDELGVLVWQEFIFACARYPGTDERFYREIEAEATFQLRRLAGRPSLIAWCGNNEIEWGYWGWGFDKDVCLPDYQLYHHLLPRLFAREDGTRHWQPSSPWSPDGIAPNDDTVGDQHPWSLGFADTDYRKYRVMACRFPNEGGVLGPNSLPTVRECLLPGEDRPWSFAWQQHDNSIAQCHDTCFTDTQLVQWLGKDLRALDIAAFVYWGGLVHGEGLTEYIINFRRRRSSSTGAAIFWMYNDVWPAVRSWTTVDHRLRRTPAFHPVRRAFQPVSVVVHEDGDRIVITGVNDTQAEVRGELRHGLFAIAGGYPLERRGAVVLAANAATELASFPRSAWGDIKAQLAFAELSVAGTVVARHRLMLPLPVELTWAPAQIMVRVEKGMAIFTSPTFAWGVCLDLDGERVLGDNYFDLFPGTPYAIPWPHAEPPHIVGVGNLP